MSDQQWASIVSLGVTAAVAAALLLNGGAVDGGVESDCPYRDGEKRKTTYVIDATDHCKKMARLIKKDCAEYPVLGFDCEKPQRGEVALLQLATAQGHCALIRLSKGFVVPKELRDILADRDIIKVGVAPLNDARDLQRDHNLTVKGTLDLRFLAVKLSKGTGTLGDMSLAILGYRLKDFLRHSDWEAYELDEKHRNYAADDALTAVEIFKRFVVAYCEDPNRGWFEGRSKETLLRCMSKCVDAEFQPYYHADRDYPIYNN